MQIFAKGANSVKNGNIKQNKKTNRRKTVTVVAMTILLSVNTGVQAYAAGAGYTLLSRIAAGSAYPAVEGLAIEKGQAYVLKCGDDNTCVFFSGEKTNLVQVKKNKVENLTLNVGHGNDMTYRKADKKL